MVYLACMAHRVNPLLQCSTPCPKTKNWVDLPPPLINIKQRQIETKKEIVLYKYKFEKRTELLHYYPVANKRTQIKLHFGSAPNLH